MDEDAQKRNTDCVYFLASPLTCKKGTNCEFRHSEAARMNPRDCWYWIHSTCRNPNCSFRHPPLEGKPAASAPPQSAATAPLPSTTAIPAVALASKSKTPCYFFSQGNCTKGDKCPFLHGPALSTSVDTSAPPKAPLGEAMQASNKPVVMLKSVGSHVPKATPLENIERQQNDFQHVNFKAAIASSQENPETAKDERAKVLRSLATSNPYQMEKVPAGRKPTVTLFSDTPDESLNSTERPHKLHLSAEERQGHPARKQQQLSHYEHERSNSPQGTDRRYQNGSKMDIWWKNESSSLDGDSSDQSMQREDDEYSSRLESRGRPKVFNDTISRVYRESQSQGREGFTGVPAHERQPRYPQHQMEHYPDYNGPMTHHGFSSRTRISVRDGQRMVSEGYTSAGTDLREHLLKRRRDDKGNPPRNESLSRRGPSGTVDTSRLNQMRDDGFNHKDRPGRVPLRGVDYRGIKRRRHDGGASPDGRPSRTSPIMRLGPGGSPDRALSVGRNLSPHRNSGLDYTKSEAREKGRDRFASKAAVISDVRSHSASKSIKSEYVKEEAGFMGPKSLSQIKAEKEAEMNARGAEGRGQRFHQLEENAKENANSRSANHQDSIASTSRIKRVHADSSGKRGSKVASSEDFEGPKPLSLLLKAKQKVEAGSEAFKKLDSGTSDSNKEVEDGEVQDEEDEWKDHNSHSPHTLLHEELAPRSESDPDVEGAPEADHIQEVTDAQDGMGSSDDGMRLEIGQTMSDDEDYELDDDDDDDFAKKLGGFFS